MKKADNRILRIARNKHKQIVGIYIGGELQDAEAVMNIKSEASMLRQCVLLEILENTIDNEAARYALEEPRTDESAEVRSTKLAFAQALSTINKMLMGNIRELAKM